MWPSVIHDALLTYFIQGTQCCEHQLVKSCMVHHEQSEDMYHCPYSTDGETEADSDTSCSKSLDRSGSGQLQ